MDKQHRYQYLDQYLKKRFGCKVFKVALNGGFSCPNRDGKISTGGCIFCSESGSGEFAGNKAEPLLTQFNEVRTIIHNKWPNAKYIAYFQANTNTYGDIERLRCLYYEAINLSSDIVALSIATRPDCLDECVLDLLEEISQKIPVWVELGLQTIHEETALYINRGYPLATFTDAVEKLNQRGIETIVHIINGLPHESIEMMIETVDFLNTLPIKGIKIHSLYVLTNTVLEEKLYKREIILQTLDEYIQCTVEQIANLRPEIIIHRINGDPPREGFIAPNWCLKKFVIMNEIDKLMKELDYYQGCKYKK